jgi:hypothetical protein
MDLNPDINTTDILFESGNADNGNTDIPSFNLAYLNLDDVVGMQFLFANIPFVYNVVDATNNQFILTDNGGAVTITLPVGTYNSTQWPYIFSQAVTTAFIAAYGSAANASEYLSYYDTVTNQIVIVRDKVAGGSFNLDGFTITTSGLVNSIANNDTFGYSSGVYTAQKTPQLFYNGSLNAKPWTVGSNPTMYYLPSPYTASLSGASEMYLHASIANKFSPNAKIYDTIVPNGMGDIIAWWPVNSVNSGSIQFSPNFPTILKCNQTTISEVTFFLSLGTQTRYSTIDQYGLNQATPDATSPAITQYLPLGGTSWQIGVRFYRKTTQSIGGQMQANGESVLRTQQIGGPGSFRPVPLKRKVMGDEGASRFGGGSLF